VAGTALDRMGDVLSGLLAARMTDLGHALRPHRTRSGAVAGFVARLAPWQAGTAPVT